MLDAFWKQVKSDWWEVTHLGPAVGYFNYLSDWVRYLLGKTTIKPVLFAYSEKDMDLNFDFDLDTKDPAFNREKDVHE